MLASQTKSARLNKSEYAVLAVVLGVVLAAIWGIAISDIQRVNRQAYQAGLATVERDSTHLSLEWEAKLAYIDALHAQAREITRLALDGNQSVGERIDELRANLRLAGEDFDLASGFDPSGKLIWTTKEQFAPNISIADRSHFQQITAKGKDRVVGGPVLSRVGGSWIIPFQEANRGTDGTLKFVTTVAVRADLIKTMSRYFDPTPSIILTLLRNDSEILAREPLIGIGSKSELRQRLINSALKTGVSSGREVSSFGGVPHIYAYRSIPGSELLVHVAVDENEVLATAHERATATIWWSIILSALSAILLVSWALAFQYRRVSRTRQAQLQRALDNEALLTRFAANATDMIALFDQEFRYIYVNDAFERTLGINASRLLGRRAGESANQGHKERLEVELAALVKEKKARRFVSNLQNAKGDWLWLDSEFVALDVENSDGPGAPWYMATTRDVTQEMAANVELLRMQEHVTTLLKMGSGILGTTTVDMAGKRLRVTVSPLSPNYELVRAAIASGDEVSLKGKVLEKDLPRLLAAYQRCIAEGSAVVEVSAIAEDGNLHQRRAQLVLAERRDETCEIVVYATDITEEYLNRQRMELIERLATLGEVTTHLAHELNQPVASIMLICENGITRLERDPTSPADAADRLGRIRLASVRLGEIINNVRRFGRADAGPRQKFELAQLMLEIEILTASRLASAHCRLVFVASHELPALNVPRLALAQVLTNLVSNACDAYELHTAVPPDQRVISVSATPIDQMLLLCVSDEAGGIPSDQIDRIFDKFFTTKPPEMGTGVGLSISRDLIRAMGGDIQVQNAHGGALFTVTIPLESRPVAQEG